MASDKSLIILGDTDSFFRWDAALRAKLAKRDLTGHVIHDDTDVDPALRPQEPVRTTDQDDTEWVKVWKEYRRELLSWKNNELQARNIILERLSEKMWPRDHTRMTAKNLYDSVSISRKVSCAASYMKALQTFHETIFTTTVDDYCDRFLTAYKNVINSADAISATDQIQIDRSIPEATAAGFFLVGTIGVDWLNSWRNNKAIDLSDRPIPLTALMSSLRKVASDRLQQTLPHNPSSIVANISRLNDASRLPAHPHPDALCKKCRHMHQNKSCFKQHPELAVGPKGQRWKENVKKALIDDKGKSDILDETSNSLSTDSPKVDESTPGIAASATNKLPYIYDTGALHC